MKTLAAGDLTAAMDGSYYTIRGVGGDPNEWTQGYEGLLEQREIGKPREWVTFTGESVNLFAIRRKGPIHRDDQFPDDLVFLAFPLEDLSVGRLAMFRIEYGDTWFDDMIENMRPA